MKQAPIYLTRAHNITSADHRAWMAMRRITKEQARQELEGALAHWRCTGELPTAFRVLVHQQEKRDADMRHRRGER